MATTQQIKALVESYVSGDDSRFRTVAMQIAARSAKHGRKQLAEELRRLLDEATARRELHVGPARAIPLARPNRDLAGLLAASYPTTRLSDMVLNDELRGELTRVVTEHRQRGRLRSPRARTSAPAPTCRPARLRKNDDGVRTGWRVPHAADARPTPLTYYEVHGARPPRSSISSLRRWRRRRRLLLR